MNSNINKTDITLKYDDHNKELLDEDAEEARENVVRLNEFIPKYDCMFRICIIGDANVGKTSLLTRYCDNVFKESYNNTIGVDFRVVTMKLGDTVAKVHIWDTAGQERFKSISINYFRSTHGFMFVYDITKKSSFHNLNMWMELAFNANKNSFANFLIGNKNDLIENREVSMEEARDFAIGKQMTFMETSAKTCINVNKTFEFFIQKLVKYFNTNKLAYDAMYNNGSLKIEDEYGDDILNSKKKKDCAC